MAKTSVLEWKSDPKSCDADVVGVFQGSDKKPIFIKGAYQKHLEKLAKSESFTAAYKTTQFIRFGGADGAESVLFVGLGSLTEFTPEFGRQSGGIAAAKLAAEKVKSARVVAASFQGGKHYPKVKFSLKEALVPFVEGMMLASYKFDKHKSKSKADEKNKSSKASKPKDLLVLNVSGDSGSFKKSFDEHGDYLNALVDAVSVTRNWSNEPSNVGTPEFYADHAKKLSKEYGLKCTIMNRADAKKEKMNLFLSVSQGSVREPKVVILEYTPKAKKKSKTICFVGKGVTFDTGGISIKPSGGMEEMKHDMTGAATVMGAVLLAAKMKASNRIVVIMPFCENMPSGNATNPGNIYVSRSGKTVEITNTDAEGRLILADALSLAQDYKPDVIIDVATLTGAIGVAIGRIACGLFGNSEKLIQKIKAIGDERGERTWHMPIFEEYFEEMKSNYADMVNSHMSRMAGASMGAIFLKQFVSDKTPWAHLDIAYTGYDIGHLSYCPKKGSSGLHVRTLAAFAEEF